MPKEVSERNTDFSVFRNGTEFFGVAGADLPSLESMTDTLSGAGIAGEVDSPSMGQYGSMTLTLNWRTVVASLLALAAPMAHMLDLRGSQQTYDAANGVWRAVPVKHTVKVLPKNTALGSLGKNASTESSNEFEVVYIKTWVDGKEVLELDKYNYIFKINGKDYLAEMRKNLAL